MKRIEQGILVFLGIFVGVILYLRVINATFFGYVMSLFTLTLISLQVNTLIKWREPRLMLPVFSFLCMLIGDIFLNFTPYAILHIASFALSLLLLTAYYYCEVPVKGNLKSLWIILGISLFLYGIIVIPSLPHHLAVHFLIYVVILTFMLWRASLYLHYEKITSKHGRAIFIGTLMFYVADILVGIRILYKPWFINIFVYILYPGSLIFIVVAPWFRIDTAIDSNKK